MKTLRATLLAIAMAAILPSGVALADVLECKMDPGFNRWYIAPVIRADFGEDGMIQGGSVKVADDLIKSTDRNSVLGTISKESDKQLVITWELRGAAEDPNRSAGSWFDPHLTIRLVIKRPGLTASLTVNDIATGGKIYRGTGKCILDK